MTESEMGAAVQDLRDAIAGLESKMPAAEGGGVAPGKATTEHRLALVIALAGLVMIVGGYLLIREGDEAGREIISDAAQMLLGVGAAYNLSRGAVKYAAAAGNSKK